MTGDGSSTAIVTTVRGAESPNTLTHISMFLRTLNSDDFYPASLRNSDLDEGQGFGEENLMWIWKTDFWRDTFRNWERH